RRQEADEQGNQRQHNLRDNAFVLVAPAEAGNHRMLHISRAVSRYECVLEAISKTGAGQRLRTGSHPGDNRGSAGSRSSLRGRNRTGKEDGKEASRKRYLQRPELWRFVPLSPEIRAYDRRQGVASVCTPG